jgi:formylmethanofuran dehydrogenase subunit E
MSIDIAAVQRFHGHMCPGLAIGIRVAEAALHEMGERPGDDEVVALVETDSCAVDAVQYLTGCTAGKGNLIHLDYGKNAYRFIRRRDAKAIRIRVIAQSQPLSAEDALVMQHWREGTATPAEEARGAQLRAAQIDYILHAPLAELVEIQAIAPEIPPRARNFRSVACDGCGEMTMETRLRLLEGRAYCPECFAARLKECIH